MDRPGVDRCAVDMGQGARVWQCAANGGLGNAICETSQHQCVPAGGQVRPGPEGALPHWLSKSGAYSCGVELPRSNLDQVERRRGARRQWYGQNNSWASSCKMCSR